MLKTIPLSKLRPWEGNPRPVLEDEHLEGMCSSLKHKGQLQTLLAVPSKTEEDALIVIGGNRRLRSFAILAEKGEIDADHGIEVNFRDIDIDDPEALMLALAENVVREQMDPIDEYAAMAKLVQKKVGEASIAAAFGYNIKTVRQRLALGRLPNEAHTILREKLRDLDWGRALTMADKATQKKICEDVRSNPAAWRDGNEIRRFLTSEAIPQDHAIFDVAAYKGRIIFDMFGTNSLSDRAEFWELQNAAIEAKREELEAQGWARVEIQHKPVDTWLYTKTDVKAEAKAIIEVLPNGKVTVHEGLRLDSFADNVQTENEVKDPIEDDTEIAGMDGVPSSAPVLGYAAALRSALIQQRLASSPRKSMEVVVAGLIGHAEVGIRGQDYRPNLPKNIASAEVFTKVQEIHREIRETIEDTGMNQNGTMLSVLARLTDDELETLFCQLVATKIGQPSAANVDGNEGSLLNTLGQAFEIDVRDDWSPNAGFFETMRNNDLRRLATGLLPADYQRGIASAKRPRLISLLEDAFNDARNNKSTMDAVDRQRLNEWTPGPFQFPAFHDADRKRDTDEAGMDALEALFDTETAEAAE